MTDAQPSLPSLEWPALIPGPVFLCFELGGKPAHKGRHRSRLIIPKDAWTHTQTMSCILKANVGKIFVTQYPDPETEAAEKVIAEAAGLFMRGRPPSTRPCAMLVHAYRQVPESWSKADKARALAGNILPTARPDGDNHLKIAKDALNEIVFKDDSQVTDSRVIKRYSDQPALRIEVREFVEPNGG